MSEPGGHLSSSSEAPPPPLVSVIIPAFNAAEHIGAALESVFAQSFSDYEVVLVNDGSRDSELLEKAIQPHLSRITYLSQENRGPSAARNAGIRKARGEWLAFLDSDDAWLPQYLERQIQFLRNDAVLDMVYCDAILQGGTKAEGKTFMQECPSNGPVTFESLMLEETQVITSGTVARRQKVIAAGLFDEHLHCSEDHDLWLRIAHCGGKISYQRVPLLRRNIRHDSQGAAPGSLLAGEIQVLQKLNETLALSPRTRSLLAGRLRTIQGKLAFIEGEKFLLAEDFERASQFLDRAQTLAPTAKLRGLRTGLRVAPRLTAWGMRSWRRHQRANDKR
jgi:hypothetical protein